MSLMAFFLSLGLGQLVYGPVSDMVGRKAPLYFGLGLFMVGSVGCALSPSIEVADRLPLRAGPRRLRRHGGAARRRARPAHRAPRQRS